MNNLLRYGFFRNIFYYLITIKNFKQNNILLKESNRRKTISLFRFEDLAKEIASGYFHPNGDIQLYGFYHALLKYLTIKKISNKIANEHGFIFSSFVHKHFICQDVIITFSDYREKHINNEYPLKKVLKIGPYIHYVESLFNESDYKDLKTKLGKTLLVFPFHSIDGVLSEFDSNELISIIEEKRKRFDSVIVCLYFKDIQLGRATPYIEKGYKVTTAGHINDAFFLNRLKSIIELSDLIISNEVGSYLAYGMYLKKRIELVRQKTSFVNENGEENSSNSVAMKDIKKHWNEYESIQDRLFDILKGEILNHDDYKYVSDLFGFNHIKTPKELLICLKELKC